MLQLLALAAVVPAVMAQTSYGCYVDPAIGSLSGDRLTDYTIMSITECETYCTGLSYDIWGVEYGGECSCGNALAVGSFPSFADHCNVACPGDPLQICGGGDRISLYGTSATPPTINTPTAPVTATQAEGCYTEPAGARALDGASAYSDAAMTVQGCGDYCLYKGFLWFGVEYGRECYCGTALNVNSTLAASPAECNMACTGASTEICGAGNRLSTYSWI